MATEEEEEEEEEGLFKADGGFGIPSRSRHPLEGQVGGLERHIIHPQPIGLLEDPAQPPAGPGQTDAARAKRGKR